MSVSGGAKGFAGGFALAALLGAGAYLWTAKRTDDRLVRYQPKQYVDLGNDRVGAGWVRLTGALIGDGMKGETYLHVTCEQEALTCRIIEAHQMGEGDLRTVFIDTYDWKIASWNKDEIVANSEPSPGQCNRVRFTVYRTNEEAVYTRVPNATADKERCKTFEKKTFSWKLADQPS